VRPFDWFLLVAVALLFVAPIIAFVFTQKSVETGSTLWKRIGWSLRVLSLLPWVGLLSLLIWCAATSRDYDPDVTKWVEVERPGADAEHQIWAVAANRSDVLWQLARHGDEVRAHLFGWREVVAWLGSRLWFAPRAGDLRTYKPFHVRDGWLVGFNEGEFGAALYWFSSDGQRSYKIADDQVVDFMSTPQGIIAIQGLPGMEDCSVVRLAPEAKSGRWTSTKIKSLPDAPKSFARLNDGRMFLALHGALAVITADNQLEILVTPTDWVRPDTIVTSADASKIYVGAQQYVCEYDMVSRKFRYLVPNLSFVNKLPKEEEENIRKAYSR
jgi:hypothetical protein